VEISVENAIIVGNTALSVGGGISVEEDQYALYFYSTLRVSNTTVENNTAAGRGGDKTHMSCISYQNMYFGDYSR
jgi:hypothetical protein